MLIYNTYWQVNTSSEAPSPHRSTFCLLKQRRTHFNQFSHNPNHSAVIVHPCGCIIYKKKNKNHGASYTNEVKEFNQHPNHFLWLKSGKQEMKKKEEAKKQANKNTQSLLHPTKRLQRASNMRSTHCLISSFCLASFLLAIVVRPFGKADRGWKVTCEYWKAIACVVVYVSKFEWICVYNTHAYTSVNDVFTDKYRHTTYRAFLACVRWVRTVLHYCMYKPKKRSEPTNQLELQ